MIYEDLFDWPKIPVPEIPRKNIEILYSLGHLDGPASGLVRWNNRIWYVERFESYIFNSSHNHSDLFWVISLTSEQSDGLIQHCEEYRKAFGSGMCWNPDGSRIEPGSPRYVEEGYLSGDNNRLERLKFVDKLYAKKPRVKDNAPIVGYFINWRYRTRLRI